MEANTYCPALNAEYAFIAAMVEGDNFDDIYKMEIRDHQPSPEDILIEKDIFRTLSDDARECARLILTCHHEFFMLNGKIKKTSFENYCKMVKGWNQEKVELLIFELSLFLRFAFR